MNQKLVHLSVGWVLNVSEKWIKKEKKGNYERGFRVSSLHFLCVSIISVDHWCVRQSWAVFQNKLKRGKVFGPQVWGGKK